jgi:hypothetical protein
MQDKMFIHTGKKFKRDKVYTGQSLYGDKVYTEPFLYCDKVYTGTKIIRWLCREGFLLLPCNN